MIRPETHWILGYLALNLENVTKIHESDDSEQSVIQNIHLCDYRFFTPPEQFRLIASTTRLVSSNVFSDLKPMALPGDIVVHWNVDGDNNDW
jgi:hypothetical protein